VQQSYRQGKYNRGQMDRHISNEEDEAVCKWMLDRGLKEQAGREQKEYAGRVLEGNGAPKG